MRELINTETQRLLDRLLQELDDENSNLDIIEKLLSEVSLKSNVDYNLWSQKLLDISLDSESFNLVDIKQNESQRNSDLLAQMNNNLAKNERPFFQENQEESKRQLLLMLLHKEKKLSQNYELILKLYEELITFTADSLKDKQYQTFGAFDENTPGENMQSVPSIQITSTLKKRADELKQNTYILREVIKSKKLEVELIKSSIMHSTENLMKLLAFEKNEDEVKCVPSITTDS